MEFGSRRRLKSGFKAYGFYPNQIARNPNHCTNGHHDLLMASTSTPWSPNHPSTISNQQSILTHKFPNIITNTTPQINPIRTRPLHKPIPIPHKKNPSSTITKTPEPFSPPSPHSYSAPRRQYDAYKWPADADTIRQKYRSPTFTSHNLPASIPSKQLHHPPIPDAPISKPYSFIST